MVDIEEIFLGMMDKRVILIINEAQFPGILRGCQGELMAIEQDGTMFLINTRAMDMIFLDTEEE